jgi:hypothetical protein
MVHYLFGNLVDNHWDLICISISIYNLIIWFVNYINHCSVIIFITDVNEILMFDPPNSRFIITFCSPVTKRIDVSVCMWINALFLLGVLNGCHLIVCTFLLCVTWYLHTYRISYLLLTVFTYNSSNDSSRFCIVVIYKYIYWFNFKICCSNINI